MLGFFFVRWRREFGCSVPWPTYERFRTAPLARIPQKWIPVLRTEYAQVKNGAFSCGKPDSTLPENARTPQLCNDRGPRTGAIDAFLCKWEKQDAKVDHDKADHDNGAHRSAWRSGSDGADRRQYRIAGRDKFASADDSRSAGRPPPAAGQSGALGEEFERSEQSSQQGRRRA